MSNKVILKLAKRLPAESASKRPPLFLSRVFVFLLLSPLLVWLFDIVPSWIGKPFLRVFGCGMGKEEENLAQSLITASRPLDILSRFGWKSVTRHWCLELLYEKAPFHSTQWPWLSARC